MVRNTSTKSDSKKASIQEKRNILTRQIRGWQEVQRVYMPGAVIPLYQAEDRDMDEDDTELETPETISLILPSRVDSTRRNAVCLHRVAEYERQLRFAQLQDSLIELRRVRRIRHTLLTNHRTQVAGQGQRANTRSRAVINSINERITKFVHRYRAAYGALIQLDPTGDWRETYLELRDEDNRGPLKEADEQGPGDGSYTFSWIWLANPQAHDTSGSGASNVEGAASEEEVNDVLRVQWTTSRARMERWAEEVELLQEEMRRVVMFLEWKSENWMGKQDIRLATAPPSVQSGLQAYARKQATICRNLAGNFSKLWHPTLVSFKLNHSWVTEYTEKHGFQLPGVTVAASRAQGAPEERGSSQASFGQHILTETLPEATTAENNMLLEDCTYVEDYDENESDHSAVWEAVYDPDFDDDGDSSEDFEYDFD